MSEPIVVEGKTLREISEEYNIPAGTLRNRHRLLGAETIAELIRPRPRGKANTLEIRIEGKTIKQISSETGISRNVLYGRLALGAETIAELTASGDPVLGHERQFVEGLYNSNLGIVRVFDIRRAVRTAFCSIDARGVVQRVEITRSSGREIAYFDFAGDVYHVKAGRRIIE